MAACADCQTTAGCRQFGCISCPASGFITSEGGATVEDGIPSIEECLGWTEFAIFALIVLGVLAMAAMPFVSTTVLNWLRPFVH
jgi:hypothetical protein